MKRKDGLGFTGAGVFERKRRGAKKIPTPPLENKFSPERHAGKLCSWGWSAFRSRWYSVDSLSSQPESAAIREKAIEQVATPEHFSWKIICWAAMKMEYWCSASIVTSFQWVFLYCKGWKAKVEFPRLPCS